MTSKSRLLQLQLQLQVQLQLPVILLWLLTFLAVKQAEHRSGTRGEEAHVSERSELCAVPSFREERREPMRCNRIGLRPAVLDQPFGCWKGSSFGYFSLHKQRRAFQQPNGWSK